MRLSDFSLIAFVFILAEVIFGRQIFFTVAIIVFGLAAAVGYSIETYRGDKHNFPGFPLLGAICWFGIVALQSLALYIMVTLR